MKSQNRHLTQLVKLALFLTVYLNVLALQAQVSITSLTPYSQDFNTLTQTCPAVLPVVSVPWVNNSTLNGWYAASTKMAINTIYASHGHFTQPGLVSYGSDALPSDRGLGWVTFSSTGDAYTGIRFKNNTGDVIRHFTITYTAEAWAVAGGNNKESAIMVGYKTGATATDLLSTGWTDVPALKITFNTGSGGSGGFVDGNLSQYRLTKTVTISDIDVAAGQEIMFRFTNTYDNNYGFYLAIDDLTITPSGTSEVYYAKSTGALNDLTTWGSNADGSGVNPPRFARSYQTFYLVNNLTPTLTGNMTVSGANSKVIVGDGTAAINCLIPAAYSFTGKMDVLNNANVTVSNATSPTFGTLGSTSTIYYNGLSNQVVSSSDFANLTVTGGDKTLSADSRITQSLTLAGAKLDLGNYNLTIDNAATLTGAGNTSYIVTSGTGSLKRNVSNNDTEVLFPVGTTNYFPIKIKQAVNGVSDIYSVRILNGLYTTYTNNVPLVGPYTRYNRGVIDKTWIVDEAVIGGSDVTLTVEWDALSALTDFNTAQARLNHYKNDAWDDHTPAEAPLSDSRYSISRSGITSFSPFGVFSDSPAALPVELLSFKAIRTEAGVKCFWETVSETNNSHFTIERSQDGKTFMVIGTEKGAGTTNQQTSYAFTDTRAFPGLTYYRIRQTDFDGSFSFSKVVAVSDSKPANSISLYPNPGNGIRVLKADLAVAGFAEVFVRNTQGQLIKRLQVKAGQLQEGLPLDLQEVVSGICFIEVRTEKETMIMRAIQQ